MNNPHNEVVFNATIAQKVNHIHIYPKKDYVVLFLIYANGETAREEYDGLFQVCQELKRRYITLY